MKNTLRKKPPSQKIGGEQNEFDLEIEPVPVEIRSSRKERMINAAIMAASAFAASLLLEVFKFFV